MSTLVDISFTLNGRPVKVRIPPAKTLLNVLREDLGITSVKPGCETGECGACTVLLDGEPVVSCLVLASQVQGRSVITVEGLGTEGNPDPLQETFVEEGAVQCGYCTPGFIIAARALLDHDKNPSVEEVKEALSGNICRCGAYPRIIRAVLKAAERYRWR